MRFNIFEGARRIALLVGVLVTVGVIAMTFNYEPYISVNYNVASPGAAFVKTSDRCPQSGANIYLTHDTRAGHSVGVTICLLPMDFGEKGELIPYKVDSQGMIWGAPSYSSEVNAYEQRLEDQFTFSRLDDAQLERNISEKYRKNWIDTLRSLGIGLVIYWACVWALGWIVRGFAGIPQGKDSRSSGEGS